MPVNEGTKKAPKIQQSVYPYSQNQQFEDFNQIESKEDLNNNQLEEDVYNIDTDVSCNLLTPKIEELTIITNHASSEDTSGIKKVLTDPTDGDWAFRGTTIIVSGILRSVAPNDFWDSETVTLFYNVTKSQYESDPLSYDSNPQYEVNSTTTNSVGVFTFQFSTSTLSVDPFSKVGKINLLTWFYGNPSRGRGAGSPGYANVTYYGRLKIDVIDSVSNPGPASYSFTTSVLFDNNTVVNTQGTQYRLRVNWNLDGVHTNQNYTFGVTNQHVYSNTAPVIIQTVTYEAWYDFSPLSINFFTKAGASDPATASNVIHRTLQTQTENQIVVDAYYVTGTGLSKIPQEIQLGTTFTIYANLSSDAGLEELDYIKVIYYYQGIGNYSYMNYQTNTTDAAIQFTVTLNVSDVADITKIFRIYLEPSATSFPDPAKRTGEVLNSILTTTINTVSIAINNPSSNFYTNGHSINYVINGQDTYGNILPLFSFQISFPGIGVQSYSALATGSRSITTTIPNYSGVDQTQTKTINVNALNKTGSSYKYYVFGTVSNTDSFNMYYSLTLTLTDPNNGNVLDGSTWTEFNNTFWQVLGQRDYQLVVTDQWVRNPIGATIYLELTGGTTTIQQSFDVTSGDNWVNFSIADFLAAGLLTTHAYTSLSLVAGGGDYILENTITQTINIYGPDNSAPTISNVVLTPDPFDPGIHLPYYNIKFNVFTTDVGTGIRSVEMFYNLEDTNSTVPSAWNNFLLFNAGPGLYVGTINVTLADAQRYVYYFIRVTDFAGHGLDEFGAKQTNPALYYDAGFGWFAETTVGNNYQIGDFIPPREEQVPNLVTSPDPFNPYLNITIYVNDSRVWSGMLRVDLIVDVFDNTTGRQIEFGLVYSMINIPSTNQWFFQIIGDYNHEYVWYYEAFDNASPDPNLLRGPSMVYSVIELDSPSVSGVTILYNGSIVTEETILSFNAVVTDALAGIDIVILLITYAGNPYEIIMTQVGATSTYNATFDLSEIPLDDYGTFILQYNIEANDTVDNVRTTSVNSLSVLYENPNRPPGGFTGSWGAIIGASAGGLVAIIAVLFLWINRHTIQTFAKKQTFRRRLRDYLREIIEDIKKDGLEGRYKEGLLKTWRVVEGIGREFYNLPRYRSQTPMEFSRLLAQRGKIERELLYTLLEYFTKARYGYEEITEKDFNSGVRALLKIVDKIEVGEMQIES